MEEETQASSVEIQSAKVVGNAVTDVDTNATSATVQREEGEIAINGDLHKTTKERNKNEEEKTALDREFITVEKEPFGAKDSSITDDAAAEEDSPSTVERTSSNFKGDGDLMEANEKLRTLELELERLGKELQHSEFEKVQLKREVVVAKEKLEEKHKHCEVLKLSERRLQIQIRDSDKYKSQLDVPQEALRTQEAKHKELIDMKQALDGLEVEESSRKNMQELEEELQSPVSNARKFKELSKESSSNADFESQKGLDLESLLEIAKSSAEEMEDLMASLREELNGLYEKIAENQHAEDALNSTVAELSAIRRELELSKLQIQDLEQKLASDDAVLSNLTEELNMRKASEQQMEQDITVLENLFLSAKEDLQMNLARLEEIELKLHEVVTMEETVKALLKNQEAEIVSVKEELSIVTGEKAALEAALEDLRSNMLQEEELCSDLETKLKRSDDNFCQADSLLSQSLSHNAELELKMKDSEALHQESETVAATSTQRNLELEDIIQAFLRAEEEAESQLQVIAVQLTNEEQKNIEIEQQLNLAELKISDADRELTESSDKISELKSMLRGADEESTQLKRQLKEYEEKIAYLESTVNFSSLKNLELEQDLKVVAEKCAEHESHASMTHQRSLELEDLIQVSQSKAGIAEQKVGEMELLLESSNYRLRELDEQIAISEKRSRDVEAESNQYSERVTELKAELETFQVKLSSLESALQTANEKELELMASLKAASEVCREYEDAGKTSGEKLSETESLMEVLRSELKSAQGKLESIEQEFKASSIRESEIMEKLEFAEEQLEEQGRIIDLSTTRSSELELLHESLAKDAELKLQEATEIFIQRDSEALDLYQKLKMLEEQAKIIQEQVTEATIREASLRAELADSSMKLVSHEKSFDELKRKVLEAETRDVQSFSENELLTETNLKLKQELGTQQIKINECQEQLSAAHMEKDVIVEQLESQTKTLKALTAQHSKVLELQSASESRIREAELQLQEAIECFTQRDSDAKDLNKRLTILETQLKTSEEHADETVAVAESRGVELEESLLKLNHLEGIVGELQRKVSQFEMENESIAEANFRLTLELAAYEAKMNEQHIALKVALVEKEEISEQLQSSRKTAESLAQQLGVEGQKLQSQKEAGSRKEFKWQAAMKLSQGELEAKDQQTLLLAKQVEELEQKLQLAEAKYEEKEKEDTQIKYREAVELTLRDIVSMVSTPPKRESKKQTETRSTQTTDMSSARATQTTEEFCLGMCIKFILGVALVSVINGIIFFIPAKRC